MTDVGDDDREGLLVYWMLFQKAVALLGGGKQRWE